MMDPLEALHYANPKVLDDIVGFKVETFYAKDNSFTNFWESVDGGLIGRTTSLKTERVERLCLEAIKKLQEES